jgi:phage repressor protein C with HTH and peptisase S24 domain
MDARPTQAELARAGGVKPPSVAGWFNGSTKSLGKALLPIASLLRVNPEWLNSGRGAMRPGGNASGPSYQVRESDPEEQHASGLPIEFVDASGSCGGGTIVWELERRTPLVKEPAWFQRYKVRPEDVFGVFADGDSMADFIIDGDIVIFDRTKVEPRSGTIFLVDHPDGLKIKRLRREIDGSWVLESNNQDKRHYPDERISPEHVGLLKILGQFVYRQGG